MAALERRPQRRPALAATSCATRGVGALRRARLPTVRDEDWRFTNVAPIGADRVRARPIAVSGTRRSPGRIRVRRRAAAAGVRQRPLRHDAVAHARGCPPASQVGSLAAALNDHADVVQRYLGQLADFSSRSFTALNTAFVQDGAFVHVPEGVGRRDARSTSCSCRAPTAATVDERTRAR